MRGPGILWGFAPLIVYAVFAGGSRGRRRSPCSRRSSRPLLPGNTTCRRAGSWPGQTSRFSGSRWPRSASSARPGSSDWMNVLVYAGLAVVAFGSVLARRPFTLPVPTGRWCQKKSRSTLGFLTANRFMTLAWGAVFAINLGLSSAAVMGPPGYKGPIVLLTFLVLAAGIAFTLWYPSHVRKRKGAAGDRAVRASDSVPGYPGRRPYGTSL